MGDRKQKKGGNEVNHPVLMAGLGTGFTFLMTAAGAGMVFFMKKNMSDNFQRVFLGFAAGVMIAASVWSLLIPAIERAEALGQIGWIPAAGGFLLGAAFLLLLDRIIPHLHIGSDVPEGMRSASKRTTMLVSAVTLHNIPEGMAVGLAFALAAGEGNYAAAFALALGMGFQNFPEGAAIALPLAKESGSKWKAFLMGSFSGVVEPVFGVFAVLVAGSITPIVPWFLAFAAGAMIYVVVEELIPEANLGEHNHGGTLGVLAGFVLMMILDVALG
ncbi:MAG: ZIP family metal transporter [Clostridia bacterium]|nr:ZIP family metal transporter [Clostridia bacterium]